MKLCKNLVVLFVLLALVAPLAADPFASAAAGEVLVKMKPGFEVHALSLDREFTVTSCADPNLKLVKFALAEDGDRHQEMSQVLDNLNNDSAVLYAHPNYLLELLDVVPNDPESSKQYMIRILALNSAWKMGMGKKQVVVAILDTGYDVNHEDLKGNLWVNTREVAGNNVDDDNNGYVDDVNGWDFVTNKPLTSDTGGHGTSCAGIIGAVGNNNVGIAGVSWNVSMMPLHIIESPSAVINAINAARYAVDNGARILSNSWRIYESWSQYWSKYPPRALQEAIEYVGTKNGIWINAAGNENNNIDTAKSCPPSWNMPHMLKVAASESADKKASFSSFGPTTVDLAAPGLGVLTTRNGGGYYNFAGTSAACPVVAGVAALVLAANPNLTAVQLRQVLNESVDLLPDFQGKLITGGRINAYKAVTHPLVKGTN
jgi:subtilisin family serine protease